MNKIILSDIDNIRKQGFRPEVVGCFVSEKKVLFVHDKEYDLWQLPQGGIDNGEDIATATEREMTEELGKDFVYEMDDLNVIGDDQLIFPMATQGSRDLKTDDGEGVHMQGKKYFFISIVAPREELDIDQTEFDDYRWLAYSEAMELCNKIYQKGKRRIIIKALNLLREAGNIK